MAKKCPDGRWSAVNSVYPEDCVEHYNVEVTVVILLFSMLITLVTCVWLSAWDWEDRTRREADYTNLPKYHNYGSAYSDVHGPEFGTTVKNGNLYSVRIITP